MWLFANNKFRYSNSADQPYEPIQKIVSLLLLHQKHAHRQGARGYRRYSLNETEQHIREHYRLPGIVDKPMGIFERGDFVLEKLEELFTHVIELNKKVEALNG